MKTSSPQFLTTNSHASEREKTTDQPQVDLQILKIVLASISLVSSCVAVIVMSGVSIFVVVNFRDLSMDKVLGIVGTQSSLAWMLKSPIRQADKVFSHYFLCRH